MSRTLPEDFGIGRLFGYVRDGVIVAEAKTERIVLWNDGASGIFGYDAQEALELELHALVPARLRARHRAGLARFQAGGRGDLLESGRPAELSGLHKDGHEVPIELTLSAIPDPGSDGERFAMAIVRDVSDRRAAEEARLRLGRADIRRQQALELKRRSSPGSGRGQGGARAGGRGFRRCVGLAYSRESEEHSDCALVRDRRGARAEAG